MLKLTALIIVAILSSQANAQYRTPTQRQIIKAEGPLGTFIAVYNPLTQRFEEHVYQPSTKPTQVTTIPMRIPKSPAPLNLPKKSTMPTPTLKPAATVPTKRLSSEGVGMRGPLVIGNPHFKG